MTTEPRSAPTMFLRHSSNGPSSASSHCSTPPHSTAPSRRQPTPTPPGRNPDSTDYPRLHRHRGRGTAPNQARKAGKAATPNVANATRPDRVSVTEPREPGSTIIATTQSHRVPPTLDAPRPMLFETGRSNAARSRELRRRRVAPTNEASQPAPSAKDAVRRVHARATTTCCLREGGEHRG
jgi:hypothetical protein